MDKLLKTIDKWKKQKTRIIALVGPKKSGKDVFLDYVKRHYGPIAHFRIAEAPTKIAKILELSPERRIQQALFGVNALLYPILGESAYKRRVARMLDRIKPKVAIVEAIRTKEEYEEFAVKRGGILVAVFADPKVRYQRSLLDGVVKKEKKDEANYTFGQFIEKEKVPVEREIEEIMEKAHFLLNNNVNKKPQFYAEIDKVMHTLGLKKTR